MKEKQTPAEMFVLQHECICSRYFKNKVMVLMLLEFNIRKSKELLPFDSMLFNTRDVISLNLPLGGIRLRKEITKNVERLEPLLV